MSGSHGGLLGMGELGELEREIDPMINLDELHITHETRRLHQ